MCDREKKNRERLPSEVGNFVNFLEKRNNNFNDGKCKDMQFTIHESISGEIKRDHGNHQDDRSLKKWCNESGFRKGSMR